MDNVIEFTPRKTTQQEAMELLQEYDPEAMLVVTLKDGVADLITTFDDVYVTNWVLDLVKGMLLQTGGLVYDDE